MLFERKDLPEIHFLKHRHDNENFHVEYENKILDSSLSPYIFKNNLTNSFLKRLQPLTSILFDQMNVMKNFKNYIVDKYYYKHSN